MPDKDLNEQNQSEEPIFKVADRRKFNLDGSLRDGVTIEEAKPKAAETAPIENVSANFDAAPNAAAAIESSAAIESNQNAAQSFAAETDQTDVSPADFAQSELGEAPFDESAMTEDELDGMNIPGADNPASFANFVLSLASQAAAALGMSENPQTGQVRVDLQSGKYLIDVLGMLQEKTKNNLHPLEEKLFSQLLGELRMQFVQIQRMAEEQRRRQEDNLMKQAAQKFSGKDILGR